jgi:replicative DNA helicase
VSLTSEECVRQHVERLEIEASAEAFAATWGHHKLDSYVPLKLGRYVLLAARPGCGKTTLGFQVAAESALRGVSATFVSLEISSADAGKKLLDAGYGAIDNLRVAPGQGLTPSGLHSICSKAASDGSRLIVVDYVQKTTTEHPRQTEVEKINQASDVAMSIARDLNVCVIGLAQINRDSDKGDKPRPPRLADLKGSGNLEQDASSVVMLHHTGEDGQAVVPMDIIVSKNRYGPQGVVKSTFDKPGGRIKEAYEEPAARRVAVHDMLEKQPTDDENLFI